MVFRVSLAKLRGAVRFLLSGTQEEGGFVAAGGFDSSSARGETQDTPEQHENRPRNQKSTRHLEPAAFKETHYFDHLFDKGTEWYRQCFLPSRQKDGKRTITGEATPGYLFHPHAAKRMVRVIPEARLIALLRNPVDRTYSAYHHRTKHRQEIQTFEETVEAYLDGSHQGLLSQSIYVDHLLRWSRIFSDEQMLVLKSEDIFEHPRKTLKLVVDFLDLPAWEPRGSELRKKVNKGKYEQRIDPAIRWRLEEYFEPHNRRLYEFLGVDFGW
jgi:hypothetical protein